MTPVRTKFLIADDDADDVMLFCEALHQIATAMKCYHVENGNELFQFLSDSGARSPEVIFLDINMPVMNGWECLTRLKGTSDYRSIPIIIYSTSSAKRDIDLAYQLGASLFLTKPEEYRELCSILEIIATTPIESMLSRLKGFASAKFT